MQLLSVGTSRGADDIKAKLSNEFRTFRKEGINVNINKKIKGNYVFLNCTIYDDDILDNSYDKIIKMFNYHAARAISSNIIENWEKRLLKKIIWKNYSYFKEMEKNKILELARTLIKGENLLGKKEFIYAVNRKDHVVKKVAEYLKHNNRINIDGFIKFRLKEYFMDLEEIVDRAVDEFLIEKEYKEFIKLLKYFIEIQEPKKEFVHVVLKDTNFDLLDQNLNELNDDFIEEFTYEGAENDISYDDLLISVLITIAPKNITVHSTSSNQFDEAIDTIKNIFEERVTLCDGCSICQPKSKNQAKK